MSKSIYKDKADKLGVPLLEPLPGAGGDPNPTIAVCGQCGLEIKKVMYFHCSNSQCPRDSVRIT